MEKEALEYVEQCFSELPAGISFNSLRTSFDTISKKHRLVLDDNPSIPSATLWKVLEQHEAKWKVENIDVEEENVSKRQKVEASDVDDDLVPSEDTTPIDASSFNAFSSTTDSITADYIAPITDTLVPIPADATKSDDNAIFPAPTLEEETQPFDNNIANTLEEETQSFVNNIAITTTHYNTASVWPTALQPFISAIATSMTAPQAVIYICSSHYVEHNAALYVAGRQAVDMRVPLMIMAVASTDALQAVMTYHSGVCSNKWGEPSSLRHHMSRMSQLCAFKARLQQQHQLHLQLMYDISLSDILKELSPTNYAIILDAPLDKSTKIDVSSACSMTCLVTSPISDCSLYIPLASLFEPLQQTPQSMDMSLLALPNTATVGTNEVWETLKTNTLSYYSYCHDQLSKISANYANLMCPASERLAQQLLHQFANTTSPLSSIILPYSSTAAPIQCLWQQGLLNMLCPAVISKHHNIFELIILTDSAKFYYDILNDMHSAAPSTAMNFINHLSATSQQFITTSPTSPSDLLLVGDILQGVTPCSLFNAIQSMLVYTGVPMCNVELLKYWLQYILNHCAIDIGVNVAMSELLRHITAPNCHKFTYMSHALFYINQALEEGISLSKLQSLKRSVYDRISKVDAPEWNDFLGLFSK